MAADFYELLGVDESAGRSEIRSAYRRAVREYHPDVNDHPDAPDQFRAVRTAYEVLSNAKERARYDDLGHEAYVAERLDGTPTMGAPASDPSSRDGTDPGATAGGDTAAAPAEASRPDGSVAGERSDGAVGEGGGGPARSRTGSATGPVVDGPEYRYRRIGLRRGIVASTLGIAVYLVGFVVYLLEGGDAGMATATDGVAVAFPVGLVALPLSFGATAIRYGRGIVRLAALASVAPLAWVAVESTTASPPAAEPLLLGVVPVGVGLAFVLDARRSLWW